MGLLKDGMATTAGPGGFTGTGGSITPNTRPLSGATGNLASTQPPKPPKQEEAGGYEDDFDDA